MPGWLAFRGTQFEFALTEALKQEQWLEHVMHW